MLLDKFHEIKIESNEIRSVVTVATMLLLLCCYNENKHFDVQFDNTYKSYFASTHKYTALF